jgi:hypothetical protein
LMHPPCNSMIEIRPEPRLAERCAARRPQQAYVAGRSVR